VWTLRCGTGASPTPSRDGWPTEDEEGREKSEIAGLEGWNRVMEMQMQLLLEWLLSVAELCLGPPKLRP
jgi:hypothetical protein